jgi:hypothetical protein
VTSCIRPRLPRLRKNSCFVSVVHRLLRPTGDETCNSKSPTKAGAPYLAFFWRDVGGMLGHDFSGCGKMPRNQLVCLRITSSTSSGALRSSTGPDAFAPAANSTSSRNRGRADLTGAGRAFAPGGRSTLSRRAR